MEFSQLPEFTKEVKKLRKKFRSIEADIEDLKVVIQTAPQGNGSKHWVILHQDDSGSILKVRLTCSSIKKTSFRVIYAYNTRENTCEFVEFIEVYSKADRQRESADRIANYINERTQE